MSKSATHHAASSEFIVSIEELQGRLGRSPYHQWLGLKIASIDPNGVTIGFTLRPDMMGNPETGALHGGIYASIIDATSSCAILARHPGSNLTIDMRVDFHRSVLIEPDKVIQLRAVGTVVRVGRTLGTADAQVRRAVLQVVVVALHEHRADDAMAGHRFGQELRRQIGFAGPLRRALPKVVMRVDDGQLRQQGWFFGLVQPGLVDGHESFSG